MGDILIVDRAEKFLRFQSFPRGMLKYFIHRFEPFHPSLVIYIHGKWKRSKGNWNKPILDVIVGRRMFVIRFIIHGYEKYLHIIVFST